MNHIQRQSLLYEALLSGDPDLEEAIRNNPYFKVEFDQLCRLLPSMVYGVFLEAKNRNVDHKELVEKMTNSVVIDPILISNLISDARKDDRNPTCVERWPDCENGEYNPSCCRYPKSCSC